MNIEVILEYLRVSSKGQNIYIYQINTIILIILTSLHAGNSHLLLHIISPPTHSHISQATFGFLKI